MASASPASHAQIANAFLLSTKGLSRRPGRRMISVAKYLYHRFLDTVRRRKEDDWWL